MNSLFVIELLPVLFALAFLILVLVKGEFTVFLFVKSLKLSRQGRGAVGYWMGVAILIAFCSLGIYVVLIAP